MLITFITFGCKVNAAETDAMRAQLPTYGAEYTDDADLADLVIVNTCAVTAKAQKDGEKELRRLKSNKPNRIIAATGCLAEFYKNEPEKLAIDFVIPNSEKKDTLAVVFAHLQIPSALPRLASQSTPSYRRGIPAINTRTRAFLKIQDGCNAYCSYCIIPQLRGKPVSMDEVTIVAEFAQLLQLGYKEIVLTGIHIGLYGADTGSSLAKLLKQLVAHDGEFRIRLTSLYLNEITDELIHTIIESGDKLARHLHISLQSGSAEILHRMGRKYDPAEARQLIARLREELSDLTIGADIIVGFPGETEALFQETVDFLNAVAIDFLHVFPYSIRPNTPAASFADQRPQQVKQQRAKVLRALATQMQLASAQRQVGRRLRVLSEEGDKGHSAGYHLVHLPVGTPSNSFIDVAIVGVQEDGSIY
jgi:threonylcarbamoyladenosine tRNA methylthiotransferase MtaB